MKSTIITILLALLSVGIEAKVYKTIKNPVAMAHNIHGGELKAREVILQGYGDDRSFHLRLSQGTEFQHQQHQFPD